MLKVLHKTNKQKDFPEMYESKKQKRIQTVDEMLRQREKNGAKVNKNPKILAGTVEAINKFVADRQAFTSWDTALIHDNKWLMDHTVWTCGSVRREY